MMRTVAWLIEAGLAVSGSYALAVDEGWTVLEAASTGSITEPVEDECLGAVTVGRQRTGQQDLRFGIDDLVEIAARLSPGVNDPSTAIACIDWLGAALGKFDRSTAAPTCLADKDGAARLFEDYLQSAFGPLRSYVAADPNARAPRAQDVG